MLAQSLSRARGAGGGLKRTHILINKRTLIKIRPQEFVSSSCTYSLPLHPSLRHQQASSPSSLLNAHAVTSSSSTAAGTAAREIRLSPYAIGPFMLATLCWSTYYCQKNCNEDLIQSIGPPAGESYQVLSLFSLYRYLELTTDGPRFDLSEMAAIIDWQSIMKMAPTRSAMGFIYYAWSTLIHGIDNSTALFPAMDIKPKLIRMGILDKLEEGLESSNSTVKLCAAYVINRLARNVQVARIISTRPRIMEGLLNICNSEILICQSSHRFQGFVHSESNTSAEVFITLLETVNNIFDATVNKNTILIGSSASHHPVSDSRADAMLQQLQPDFIGRMATILRHMELCDEHIEMSQGLFSDHHMNLYQRFFPRSVDDQVRRRMREVEAEVARFLSVVSKDKGACERLLLDREILKSLSPLAIDERRNASAYVHAVGAVHNILDRYLAIKPAKGTAAAPAMSEENVHATSLLVDSHVNRQALLEAAETVAEREEGSVGRPFARITSIYGMRCYTSSLACMVAGGVWGILRTPANPLIHPIVAYSVNGVGAMLLNVLYGTYGVRNWMKNRTYIEDDNAHMAWTWSQVIVDAGVITTIVRRHPYSLLPMLVVNMLGHNTYPGTGLHRLDDGPDFAFRLF